MNKAKKIVELVDPYFHTDRFGSRINTIKQETAVDGIDDEIGNFWVVTAASDVSELEDIMFKATVGRMMIQSRGGLDPEDVLGIFKDKNSALEMANRILQGKGKPGFPYRKGHKPK